MFLNICIYEYYLEYNIRIYSITLYLERMSLAAFPAVGGSTLKEAERVCWDVRQSLAEPNGSVEAGE